MNFHHWRYRWADVMRFLGKLSVPKLYNAAVLVVQFYYSLWSRRPVQPSHPMTLAVEPTTACNLRCPECPSGMRSFTRPTGKARLEEFEALLEQVHRRLIYLILYFQGEPFLHPDFERIVAAAHRYGVYTITSTNGHFLTPERCKAVIEAGLDRLIISVDGVTQESYARYRRRGDLERVIEGIRTLHAMRQRLGRTNPRIVVQFIVFGTNEHELSAMRRAYKLWGADDLAIKTAQVYDYIRGNPLIPRDERYSRYRRRPDGSYEVKYRYRRHRHCWKMWHSAVVTWDGRVVPCCFDKDAEHVLGILTQRSFEDIWRGASYRAFRRRLIDSRSHFTMCKNCSEGVRVWL